MKTANKRAITKKGMLTHEKVVKAGIDCIAELGFHAASTNKIASKAGVTWGTLQHQFGDKATLLEAIVDYAFDEQIRTFQEATDPSQPLRERISNMANAFWKTQDSPASIALTEITRSMLSDPEYRPRFLKKLARLRHVYDQFWLTLFADVKLCPKQFEATKHLATSAIRGLALNSNVHSSDSSIIDTRELLETVIYNIMANPEKPASYNQHY